MPCLVVDCGGVLSSKDGQRFDGSDIYKQAVPGAYAFCQLFTKAYGHQQLQVLSRVNHPSEDYWVVRFCETMNLPHVSLVKDRWQKGPVSQQLGAEAAVDDNSDCLYYISWYCWQSMEASSLHKQLRPQHVPHGLLLPQPAQPSPPSGPCCWAAAGPSWSCWPRSGRHLGLQKTWPKQPRVSTCGGCPALQACL